MYRINHLLRTAAATALLAAASQLWAVPVTIGTTNIDTDNSVTSATLSTTGTISTSFFGVGIFPEDTVNSVATLLGAGGGEQSIDIATSGTFDDGRTTIEAAWDSGMGVENQPGDDIFVVENGGAGRPEAFGVTVREFGDSGFRPPRYEFADEYDAGRTQYITGYDLSDFGIGSGAFIDAVQIISLHNLNATTGPNFEDRVDDVSHEGNLTLDVGSGSGFAFWGGPLGTDGTFTPDPGGEYADSAMDADITYVAGSNVGVAAALPFSFCDDFNADTSADYLELAEDLFNTTPGTEDVSVTFAFDYGALAFVDTSDAHTIPVAPNTTDATQLGLKLEANIIDDNGGTGEGAAVNLFPLDGGSPLDLPDGVNYRMSFDLYMNLGSGTTTEFMVCGVNTNATYVTWRDAVAGSDGLGLANTGDGGGGEDYILYVGQGVGVPPESNDAPSGTLDPLAIGFPNGEDNNLDAFFQALFPTTNGTPVEQWVEVEVSDVNDILTWRLNGTTILTHDIASLSSFTSGTPFLGYTDFFSSVAGDPGDNFGLVDNLCIEELIVTPVGGFDLYR